ncbi:MAG: hypothetical protein ABR540_10695 [Acidimicrobiales bacterium]|nr:hypothetical protein [Actinomycetota bacterium]
MELLLLVLVVVVVLALVGGFRGPAWYGGRRSRGPVVRETVYEDEPVRREHVVEEIVEDVPVSRRRRIVDY